MIDKLIERTFKLRDAAHRQHWATDNGEEHRALGEFYDGLIDGLDGYVEVHQGAFGLVGKPSSVTQQIRDQLVWICENRSAIAKGLPALENLIDEQCALYLRTLYKLEHLR